VRTWTDLYVSHRRVRTVPASWTTEVRKKLIALADAKHCDEAIRGRFSNQSLGDVVEWSIRKNGSRAAEPLTGLADLESAEISVEGLVSKRGHLHAFTVSVQGKRKDGSSWSLAVDLPDDRETTKNPSGDRQGLGACSHAAFHCHVGTDRKTAPEVRVPLPALGPADALEWVLSQLVPTAKFEPALWAEVQAALEKASP
jgi:hypothetical protein